MHPLHRAPENSPPVSDHSRNKKLVTDIEPDKAVERSEASLSQEGSWPNGPPPAGPKWKYNYGASTAAVASAGRGSTAETGPWTLHSFGNSLQLQRAEEPSPSSKRRRLSYDHYSPPKPSPVTTARPHESAQHNDEEHVRAHEIHRQSPPPRGRLSPLRTFSSNDRGFYSWRPERSYERRISPVRSTSTKLPRSSPVLSDHALNRGQETNPPSEGYNLIAKSKPTREELPDSDHVGSQTCLLLEGMNEVTKTSPAKLSDTRAIPIPRLVNRRPSTTGSPPENMEPNESLRSPQIGSIEGNRFNTSVVGTKPPGLPFETAVSGSEAPKSSVSVSIASHAPLIASSSARRAGIHSGAERASFTRRASAAQKPFAGLPASTKQIASEERVSSGTSTPDAALSARRQEPEVVTLLSTRAENDPNLAELIVLVAGHEATSDQETLFNDVVTSLRREVQSGNSKGSPCEVTNDRTSLERRPKIEGRTRESNLKFKASEGNSEKLPPVPKAKSTGNRSLAGPMSGASLDPPDLVIPQLQPSTTTPSSIPKATMTGRRRTTCARCRKKKIRCSHRIPVVVEQNNTQGCEECELKHICCLHRELLVYSETENAILATSDSEKSTNLPPAKSGHVNRALNEQFDGPADGLGTGSEFPVFENRQAEDMGTNSNSKRIRLREKRMVPETPDATSSKTFENGSSVAPRNFKAAKGNPIRQNARNLFTCRNETERDVGGPPRLPRCLGCGKLVFGTLQCSNCESIHADSAKTKNTTATPETPEVMVSGHSNPEQNTVPLPSAAESSTPSTNPAQPRSQNKLTSRGSSASTQSQSLLPRKRKRTESRLDSGHSDQLSERYDCPPHDILNHLSTKFVSTKFVSTNKVELPKRIHSKDNAETQLSSPTDLRQMQAKDTEEIERLIHQNLRLQEELHEKQDEKQKQADELERARKEIAELKNKILSRSPKLLEANENDQSELEQPPELSDEADSSPDLTLEPYAYEASKYPPLKPYVPAYRRPRVSTDLYEIAPHLHTDNVFFDKEAKIREIEARPSRKATFGKVLAKSRR